VCIVVLHPFFHPADFFFLPGLTVFQVNIFLFHFIIFVNSVILCMSKKVTVSAVVHMNLFTN